MKFLAIAISMLGLMVIPAANSIHTYTANDINDQEVKLSDYDGKIVLIVNTASECGFTPQYEQLQAIYQRYNSFGFEILGFPCNQFGGQEPGNNNQIAQFCSSNYGVTFPMFSKIDVKGENQHPIYKFLTDKELNGVKDSEVQWNFQKYLLDRNGKLVEVYGSDVDPYNADFLEKLNRLLLDQ